MNDLITVFTSASRPDLLRKSYASAKKFLDINKYSVVLHEDFCVVEKSKEILHWAKYEKILTISDDEEKRMGLIGSCKNMLSIAELFDCRYVLRLCDDFVFTKKVDLYKLVYLMDRHPKINQIIFNKRANNAFKGEFIKKERYFDTLKLTTSPRWSSLNSIWRVNFIKPYFDMCWGEISGTEAQYGPWKVFTESLERNFINSDSSGYTMCGFKSDEIDADWIIENLGCYLYGGIGDTDCCVNEHIGDLRSRVFPKLNKK